MVRPLLLIVVAAAALLVRSQPRSGSIEFEEKAAQAGLRFTTLHSPTPNKNQVETMVAGIALLDYDEDGYLDVFCVNGAAIPSLTKASPAYWNRLFHNNRDGTFTDVTEKAGVSGSGYGMGAAAADYDNDGRMDLFVANVTANQLLHNNGDGTFTDVTAKAGLAGARDAGVKMWSVGAGWFDYNNDGLLDLFVVNYCRWKVNQDPYCSLKAGVRAYCHPKYYEPLSNTLYRNNGDGTFTDVSRETGIAAHRGKGMSVSFADYDSDGYLDAFVANDTTPNFLFHNLGGKKFEEVGLLAGVAFSPEGSALSGMGSDFRDIDNDGLPDIWHTAVEHESFPLYLNRGKGRFVDGTAASGLSSTSGMSGWGNGVFDFDNDGWKDLFVARSNVMDNIQELYADRPYPEPNTIFRNLGKGRFAELSGAANPVSGAAAHRGAAFGDLDNDGRVDVVVSVLGGPLKLYRNTSPPTNHWLALKLVGTRSNRTGIGAEVRITTQDGQSQWNQGTTAVGYACSSDARVFFGVGANRSVREIEVRWPGGGRQTLRDVAADQFVVVEQR